MLKQQHIKLEPEERHWLEQVVEAISNETVRQTLHSNALKPWQKEHRCLPAKSNAEFVCAMEDVLEVYHRPSDA